MREFHTVSVFSPRRDGGYLLGLAPAHWGRTQGDGLPKPTFRHTMFFLKTTFLFFVSHKHQYISQRDTDHFFGKKTHTS